MAILLTTKCSGLHTQPNELGEVPEGALSQADDVVVQRDGIIEPRRGFVAVEPTPHETTALVPYNGVLVAVQPNVAAHATATVISYSNAAVTEWTSYVPGEVFPMPFNLAIAPRTATHNGAIYITTDTFVLGLGPDPADGGWYAGLTPGRDILAALHTGTGQLLPTDSAVAYRAVYYWKDLVGAVHFSAPSGRVVVANTSGSTKDVDVTVPVPSTIRQKGEAAAVQLYRTQFVSGATISPGDEMALVGEVKLQGSETSVTFTDTVTYIGAALYTNASQQGILQANYPPPLARDLAMFRECMFYANTSTPQSVDFRLMAAHSGAGLQLDDTVTFGGLTFTGASTETTSTFRVSNTGTASIDIRETAASLIRVFNAAIPGYFLQNTSSENDPPGMMRLTQANRIYEGTSADGISSSRSGAFLPILSDLRLVSESRPNRIYYSKQGEPESVPLVNYFDVGASDKAILRIVPLRDALIVFKEDDGIWKVTGDGPFNFRVDPFDLTVSLVAPDTAQAIDSTIICLSTQGVIRVSDTGVTVLSRPIEDKILPLLTTAMGSVTQAYAFAVAQNTQHRYMLWAPTVSTDTKATQAFIYDLYTETWVRWTRSATAGASTPADDKLYLANGTAICKERRDYVDADYQDEAGAAIDYTLRWTPKFGDRPDVAHQFREVAFLYRASSPSSDATISFGDTVVAGSYVSTSPVTGIRRVLVPRAYQRSATLSVTLSSSVQASKDQITGVRVVYETGSERVRR